MGQSLTTAVASDSCNSRSPKAMSQCQLARPLPMPPNESQSAYVQTSTVLTPCVQISSGIGFVDTCIPIGRRRNNGISSEDATWSWQSEGRRTVEWQRVAQHLQDVLHGCALVPTDADRPRMCRMTILVKLIDVYWEIHQLISQRALYIEECMRWIIYAQSSRISIHRILLWIAKRLDLPSVSSIALTVHSLDHEKGPKPRKTLGEFRQQLERQGSDPLPAEVLPLRAADIQEESGIGYAEESDEELEDSTMVQVTGNSLAAIIHSAFPNIAKQIIVQELGFIERSIRCKGENQLVSGALDNNATEASETRIFTRIEKPTVSFKESVKTKMEVFRAIEAIDESQDESVPNPDLVLSPRSVELFFRKQLPMFLSQEISSEKIAIERLTSIQNNALAWIRHVRGELRRKYVEMLAWRLDIEGTSEIALTESQLQALFNPTRSLCLSKINISEYLQKSQTLDSGPSPIHLEPDIINDRIKPSLRSPLTSITGINCMQGISLSLSNPAFPRPPIAPSLPRVDQSLPRVTFKLIERFFHACLLDRVFFESIWSQYQYDEIEDSGDEQGHCHLKDQYSLSSPINPRGTVSTRFTASHGNGDNEVITTI